MADLIMAAEGNDDEESDDSEAERRAAYEAAQTRAGMDGLHKPDDRDVTNTATQMPSKITPLPVLTECLARLQNTLSGLEMELARKRRKLEESKKEKEEISVRESEVQALLKQAGARYAALKVDATGVPAPSADPESLLDGNGSSSAIIDRGLESFGNTPTVRPAVEDVG
jgi:predicted RNase H-like nuclease (RuvC/YqgF family)